MNDLLPSLKPWSKDELNHMLPLLTENESEQLRNGTWNPNPVFQHRSQEYQRLNHPNPFQHSSQEFQRLDQHSSDLHRWSKDELNDMLPLLAENESDQLRNGTARVVGATARAAWNPNPAFQRPNQHISQEFQRLNQHSSQAGTRQQVSDLQRIIVKNIVELMKALSERSSRQRRSKASGVPWLEIDMDAVMQHLIECDPKHLALLEAAVKVANYERLWKVRSQLEGYDEKKMETMKAIEHFRILERSGERNSGLHGREVARDMKWQYMCQLTKIERVMWHWMCNFTDWNEQNPELLGFMQVCAVDFLQKASDDSLKWLLALIKERQRNIVEEFYRRKLGYLTG